LPDHHVVIDLCYGVVVTNLGGYCVYRRNWRYDYFLAEGGHVGVEMQNNRERVDRFIEAFEKLYGRKPQAEDANGDFKIQVAQDMQMSVGGARYYIRLASERKAKEK